jgi:hypothetical protein
MPNLNSQSFNISTLRQVRIVLVWQHIEFANRDSRTAASYQHIGQGLGTTLSFHELVTDRLVQKDAAAMQRLDHRLVCRSSELQEQDI